MKYLQNIIYTIFIIVQILTLCYYSIEVSNVQPQEGTKGNMKPFSKVEGQEQQA